jgi:hypothetical protein
LTWSDVLPRDERVQLNIVGKGGKVRQVLLPEVVSRSLLSLRGARACRRINVRRRAKLDGRWVDYLLHDEAVRFLKGRLRLRQVTRLCDGGHQTNVRRTQILYSPANSA